MSGDLLKGRFPDESTRLWNRASNAVWFARIGVYATIDTLLMEDPEADIDAAIKAAYMREAAALTHLSSDEREDLSIEFNRECARASMQEGPDYDLDAGTNVVQAAFDRT